MTDSTVSQQFCSAGADGHSGRAQVAATPRSAGNLFIRGYDGTALGSRRVLAPARYRPIASSPGTGRSARGSAAPDPDIAGAITFSNGHNVFGSDVVGNIPGDRENIAPSAIFAAIDPDTGGGKLSPDGTVPLRNNLANPALSGGDPLAASASTSSAPPARSRPAACPTSARSSSTSRSRPAPPPTTTCSPAPTPRTT